MRLSYDGRVTVLESTMEPMEVTIRTLEDLDREASRFVATLVPGTGATLITLSGELGAGKTAFVKACARALGIDALVNSPTFVLEKIYAIDAAENPFKRLVHIDAYRLDRGADLGPLGFNECMQDAYTLIFLEWPEKVADVLPPPAFHITLSPMPDGNRTLTYV